MRVVIQKVRHAQVVVEGKNVGEIAEGLLLLLGITHEDDVSDIEWICKKIVQMRIFPDAEGKMNLSLIDVQGDILLISQFTLHASTKKGNRPSFIHAARPDKAKELYHDMGAHLEQLLGKPIEYGRFGAHMEVSLLNDGPVTIIMDSKDRV